VCPCPDNEVNQSKESAVKRDSAKLPRLIDWQPSLKKLNLKPKETQSKKI
jgi:hypothetical protein